MLCRSFRCDQILYLFLLFPSVNFRLSISAKADRSLMQSVWNQMFLFPTSLEVTLWPMAGRLQLAPESTLASNNPQHAKYQTKMLLMFSQLFSHVTAETGQVISPWMREFIAFLFPPAANCGHNMPDVKNLLSVRAFTD